MPYVDTAAAARIVELREGCGLSPEALAEEIRQLSHEAGWKLGAIDAYTIRRIEGNEHRYPCVPTIRVQCILGLYFGVPHQEIWRKANRVWMASPYRDRVAA